MPLSLCGFEICPRKQFHDDLSEFMASSTGGWAGGQPLVAPSPSKPVYEDETGNRFTEFVSDEGVVPVPFIEGSPIVADDVIGGGLGGFISAEDAGPFSGGSDPIGGMLGSIIPSLPGDALGGWIGNAAGALMTGGAAGGTLGGVMNTLGMGNGMSGPLGAAIMSAGSAAGAFGGPVGSLMPALGTVLGGGGTKALSGLIGSQAANKLMGAAGLQGVPGMGAVAGILGDSVGQQLGGLLGETGLGDLLGGGGDAVGDLASSIGSGCFGDGGLPALGSEGELPIDPTGGGCFPGAQDVSLESITPGMLDSASDELLNQWQVDDESSAAEQIAHKAVTDNKAKIKEAVSDPNGFMEKIQKFFEGESSTAFLPAARIGDKDDKVDLVASGMATVQAEGMPIGRITDTLVPSGKIILEGSSTVLSGELPTARITSKTAIPSVIGKGAAQVLVGGGTAAINPPAPPADPSTSSNSGPAGPDSPDSASTGSGGAKKSGDGQEDGRKVQDSKEGDGGAKKPSDASGADKPGDAKDASNKTDGAGQSKEGIGEAGDAAAGAKEGVEEKQKLNQEAADAEAEAKKAKAQSDAEGLKSKAEKSGSQSEQARATADKLDRQALETQRAATSNADLEEAMQQRGRAEDAKQNASDLETQAKADKAVYEKAKVEADSMPNKGVPKGGGMLDAAKKGLSGAGMGVDVLEAGTSIAKMKELGEQGENRAVIREASSTIGSLGGGMLGASAGAAAGTAALAVFGVATGGIGLLVVGGAAAAGGYIFGGAGSAVGDQVGDVIADRTGYENRSGNRKPTWLDQTKTGWGVIKNGQVGQVMGWW